MTSNRDAKQPAPLLVMRGVATAATGAGRSLPVLRGIDLTVRRGEMVAVVGETASGKSSLARAAMGYAPAGTGITAGTVTFDGIDLLGATAAERRISNAIWGRRLALVPDAITALDPATPIIDQVCEVPLRHRLMTRREAESAAISLFRDLRLPNPERIGQGLPHHLTPSQAQRVLIAIALAAQPELVLLDEPTAHLDLTTQADVLAMLKAWQSTSGAAMLMLTHDLALAAPIAHRIAVLKHGRILEEGPAQALLANPQDPHTRALASVRHTIRPTRPSLGAAMVPVLAAERLAAGYGPIKVLSDISFAIHSGRTLAVAGESGSGKSALARCAAGLLPSSRGRLSLAGQLLPARARARSSEQLRRVQFMHRRPDTALSPHQRVADAVARPLVLAAAPAPEARAAELLALVGLSPHRYASRLPAHLSAGQQQLVCLARALAASPSVLVCDEPTALLDPIAAVAFLHLLGDLQQQFGFACLFVAPDMATARAIADDIIVMRGGRIIDSGTSAAIFEAPRHDYTGRLIAAVPRTGRDWLPPVAGDPV